MVTEKPVSAMRADEAIALVNCVARSSGIEVRGGMAVLDDYVNIGTSQKRNGTLHFYTTTAVREVYGDCTDGIRSYNTGGLVQADAHTLLSRPYVSQQYTNVGGTYLYMLRPGQTPFLYNGAAWQAVTGVSAPVAITGVVTTTLEYVFAFKRRLWFIQTGTQNLWYLAADAIGGGAVAFPIGPLLTKGGSPLVLFSWSGPQGDGIDDYFCILTTEGELIVYQGTDPSAAATFALVGVFFVGRPLEQNVTCFVKMGGDVLLMTNAGIFSVGSILNGKQPVRENSLTAAVHSLYLLMTQKIDARYHDGSIGGNSLKLFYSKNESLLLVAMISANADGIVLVYCTESKAWSFWTEHPVQSTFFDSQEEVTSIAGALTRSSLCADCILYDGTSQIRLADVFCRTSFALQGDSDITFYNIHAVIVSSPQAFGSMQKKALKLIRPIFSPGGLYDSNQTVGANNRPISIVFSADFASLVSETDASESGDISALQNPQVEAVTRHTEWLGELNAPTGNRFLEGIFNGIANELFPRSLYTYQWRDIIAASGSSFLLGIYHQLIPSSSQFFPGWIFEGIDVLYEPADNFL
jgi:hypothetical protein